MEIKMAPSLLAADFLHLEDEIRRAEASGADWLHCDVMDGVYVPNISFGFPVISPIGALAKLPLDVHMMTVCPEKYVDRLAEAGAASVTIHTDHTDGETVRDTLKAIRSAGMRAAGSDHDGGAGFRRTEVHEGHDAEGPRRPGGIEPGQSLLRGPGGRGDRSLYRLGGGGSGGERLCRGDRLLPRAGYGRSDPLFQEVGGNFIPGMSIGQIERKIRVGIRRFCR